jgi:hypothetical protein
MLPELSLLANPTEAFFGDVFPPLGVTSEGTIFDSGMVPWYNL